uniref:Uncharacterized protein n=1 Tax=Gossypium raimondii TaxID=29730 RepID=A0A0D2URA1_GOSRA|nr:hypothetical protein B456_011G091600 [Gossypium raimondii]
MHAYSPLCSGPTTKRLFGSLYSDSPESVTGLLPLLRVTGITLPQRLLAIPPPFHLLFSIFYPHHKASIFCPILPRFLAQRYFSSSHSSPISSLQECLAKAGEHESRGGYGAVCCPCFR